MALSTSEGKKLKLLETETATTTTLVQSSTIANLGSQLEWLSEETDEFLLSIYQAAQTIQGKAQVVVVDHQQKEQNIPPKIYIVSSTDLKQYESQMGPLVKTIQIANEKRTTNFQLLYFTRGKMMDKRTYAKTVPMTMPYLQNGTGTTSACIRQWWKRAMEAQLKKEQLVVKHGADFVAACFKTFDAMGIDAVKNLANTL